MYELKQVYRDIYLLASTLTNNSKNYAQSMNLVQIIDSENPARRYHWKNCNLLPISSTLSYGP